jgi:hypothetical protein
LNGEDIWEEGGAAVCGTVGCAAGWAAKLLPELGLTMEHGAPAFKPPGGEYHQYDYAALAECFDIPYHHARRLFGYENVSDRVLVAKNIRRYVETGPHPEDYYPPFAAESPLDKTQE